MALTVNDGGVLKSLGTVSVSDGGVIRNLGSVSVNDGGVLKSVFSANKVKVEGVVPAVVGDDYMVFTSGGTFTLSAPAGARIILGGGGQAGQQRSSDSGKGGSGGYVAAYTLSGELKNASCTLTLGAAVAYGVRLSSSSLKLDSKTYTCGSAVQIVQTKWGPIGGSGGDGYYCSSSANSTPYKGTDGTGAGGGGGGIKKQRGGSYYGKGGNIGGYGNHGGNGDPQFSGDYGSCGAGGSEASDNDISGTKVGGAGGGGYSAGGGGNSCQESVWYNSDEDCNEYDYSCGYSGRGGAGILVIEWTN